MILHFLKADWQRLRVPILLGWIVMILMAIPTWFFDFGEIYPDTILHSPFQEVAQLTLPELILRESRALGYLLLGISAALGFAGISWTRTMPLKPRDAILGKAAGLLLFLVIPQLAVIAAVAVNQGFGVAELLPLMVCSGPVLFLIHLLSMAFGRLCGGFWPCLVGAVIIFILSGMKGMVQRWLSLETSYILPPDVWGGNAAAWWQLTISIIAVAILLLSFKHRRPALRIALGSLALAAIPVFVEPVRPSLGGDPSSSIPDWKEEVRPELTTRSIGDANDAYLHLHTPGLPPGTGISWMLERSYPLRADGREIAHYAVQDRPMGRGSMISKGLSTLFDRDVLLPASPQIPYPEEFVNHRAAGSVYMASFDAAQISAAGNRLDLDARLLGVVARYEKVLELPVGEKATLRERETRSEIHLEAGSYPLLVIDSVSAAVPFQRRFPTDLRVILYMPAEKKTIELTSREYLPFRLQLLGPVAADRRIFAPSEFWNVSRNQEGKPIKPRITPPDLTGARILLFRPEILGKVHTRLQASQLAVSENRIPSDGLEVVHGAPPGPANGSINCSIPMPDPATCTRQEAAYWLNHVLVHHDRGDWPVQALGPFVRRFPGLFLNDPPDARSPLIGSLTAWFPESDKKALVAAAGSNPAFVPVLSARGWLEDARPMLMEEFRSAVRPGRELLNAICQFEDPSTYPKLIESLRDPDRPADYFVIRELPGILPLLDLAMQELGEELARQRPKEPFYEFSLRGALEIPAAHGVRSAFDRLWEHSVSSKRDFDTQPWRQISSVIIAPSFLGENSDLWKTFLSDHSPQAFDYDSLALKWRMKTPDPVN